MADQLLGWLGLAVAVLTAVAGVLRLLRLNLRLTLDCLMALKAIGRELLPSRRDRVRTDGGLVKVKEQRSRRRGRPSRRKA